jgi:hypothetical protein
VAGLAVHRVVRVVTTLGPQAPLQPARRGQPPARRPLQIFAFDPMVAQSGQASMRTTVDVPYEDVRLGPSGSRVRVVDFDGTQRQFYEPVDLNDPWLLLSDGLAPSERDPRFHQQMAYAVTARVLDSFDRALGRRIRPRGGCLTVFPHAFERRNAFYQPDIGAVLLGYFRASVEDPGPNLPGQTVFTCLSHDIVAHEVTHALVHRLRPSLLLQATNEDSLAFHEALADIVALLLHFSLPGVLHDTIATTRTNLWDPTPLVELAAQFGFASGQGEALRSALDESGPADPSRYRRVFEPHERGSILVAAVFDAFFRCYQARIADLVRLATGGSGILPAGRLPPDLVDRVAAEATRTARQVLNICVRAFDYLPAIDVTFSDYLRALVTVDRELYPQDDGGLRAALIEAFRQRGIYPDDAVSLSEDSLAWEDRASDGLPSLPFPPELLHDAVTASGPDPAAAGGTGEDDEEDDGGSARLGVWAKELNDYAGHHADLLGLHPDTDANRVRVTGLHTGFRQSADTPLRVDLVVQFTQRDRGLEGGHAGRLDGTLLQRGTTVVADADGRIRYVIAKPLPLDRGPGGGRRAEAANERLERQLAFVADSAQRDAYLPFADPGYRQRRLKVSFARLHGNHRGGR